MLFIIFNIFISLCTLQKVVRVDGIIIKTDNLYNKQCFEIKKH